MVAKLNKYENYVTGHKSKGKFDDKKMKEDWDCVQHSG